MWKFLVWMVLILFGWVGGYILADSAFRARYIDDLDRLRHLYALIGASSGAVIAVIFFRTRAMFVRLLRLLRLRRYLKELRGHDKKIVARPLRGLRT